MDTVDDNPIAEDTVDSPPVDNVDTPTEPPPRQYFVAKVSPEKWEEIKADRLAGMSYGDLSAKHNLAKSAIFGKAKQQKWDKTPAKERKALNARRTGTRTNGTQDGQNEQENGDQVVLPSARIPKTALVPWLPGASPNPGGLSKPSIEGRRMARAAVPEAVQRAVDMMRSCHPGVASQGVHYILTWGLPKPSKDEVDTVRMPALDFRSMSPAELDIADAMLRSMEQLQALTAARVAAEAKAAPAEIIPPGAMSERELREQAEDDSVNNACVHGSQADQEDPDDDGCDL